MHQQSALKPTLIYVMRINDEAHHGALKVGMTTLDQGDRLDYEPNDPVLTQAAHARIGQYTKTAGITYELLYTELATKEVNGQVECFNDNTLRAVLRKNGIKKKTFPGQTGAREWVKADLETVKNAIAAYKSGRTVLTPEEISTPWKLIVLRKEQREAVDKTMEQFQKKKLMLWDCKPRFGKTVAALQLIKEMVPQRTLIITHRPTVDVQWQEDFLTKVFPNSNSMLFATRGNGDDSLIELEAQLNSKNKTYKGYIYFASIQDLRGSQRVGGNFDKNELLYQIKWDLVVVDEAHEGYLSELGQKVDRALTTKETRKLLLSGTPFNLFDLVEDTEGSYSWTYADEQRAKKDWLQYNLEGDNPYEVLPQMEVRTYNLGYNIEGYSDNEYFFNFREFFSVEPSSQEFVHKDDVLNFLNLLCREGSHYPFSTPQYRDMFRHTLWMLPGVKEARALEVMINQFEPLSQFQVVNVAGDGSPDDPIGNQKSLYKVRKAIGDDPEATRTITLSCGRLTTGVTVPEWTAVLMLRGAFLTSAKEYMQTMFRAQSPWTFRGKMKTKAYMFDFAPDRTLQVLTDAVQGSRHDPGKTDREVLEEFLNFCPVIGYDGSKMIHYDVDAMMRKLKQVKIERVVRSGFEDPCLYSDKLAQISDQTWQKFEKLKRIVGQTSPSPRNNTVEVNKQGLTTEKTEEGQAQADQVSEPKPKKIRKTEEQKRKDRQNRRLTALSILRGISVRMPLMIYGAELKEEDKITLEGFADLIDPASWQEFMPRGVTKAKFKEFIDYFDADVFAAAAQRIRALAREADDMALEQRIEQITLLFETFRNPDKETVLTPWRVVNMHISQTLGGYTFYDENFEKALTDPHLVTCGSVTAQVFHPETYILDINSKTGLYSLYAAYSVYQTRLSSGLFTITSREDMKQLWADTLRENVFAVCKTPMARSITRRTLGGFSSLQVNALYFKDLVQTLKTQPEQFIKAVKRSTSFSKDLKPQAMKFDAVIGNPPYQELDGGAGVSATPVYNSFVDAAKDLKPDYLSLIIPAKWYTDGKGIDKFRTTMLADRRIKAIFDFPDSKDVFPWVDVAGGICFFHWERNYQGDCLFTVQEQNKTFSSIRNISTEPILIRYVQALHILKKVTKITDEFYDIKVSTQKPFGLRTFIKPLESGDIEIKTNQGFGPYDSHLIKVNADKIPFWKVICSRLSAEHAGQADKEGRKKIISSLDLLKPGQICSETYLMIDAFPTEVEAIALCKYVRTQFFRFLVSLKAGTQQMSKEKFGYVPMQEFGSGSDIDWSVSVSEVDQQLYMKYGLSDEEITFIESKIKPMV